jgi:hypothetical protein
LKAPGFNPFAYKVISWFQAFAFKFNFVPLHDGYKRAHLESSEATLHAEIARLQQHHADAERTAVDAVKSRDRFKTQIQKMGRVACSFE